MNDFYDSWFGGGSWYIYDEKIKEFTHDSSEIQKRIDTYEIYYWSNEGVIRILKRIQGLLTDNYKFKNGDSYYKFLKYILNDLKRPIAINPADIDIGKFHKLNINIFVYSSYYKKISKLTTDCELPNSNDYSITFISNSKKIESSINGCCLNFLDKQLNRLDLPTNYLLSEFEYSYFKRIRFKLPTIKDLIDSGGLEEQIQDDVYRINHTKFVIYYNEKSTLVLFKSPMALIVNIKDINDDNIVLFPHIIKTNRPIRILGAINNPRIQMMIFTMAFYNISVLTIKNTIVLCKTGYEGIVKIKFKEYEDYTLLLKNQLLNSIENRELFSILENNIYKTRTTLPYKSIMIKLGFYKTILGNQAIHYWYGDLNTITLGSYVIPSFDGIKIMYTVKNPQFNEEINLYNFYMDILHDKNYSITFNLSLLEVNDWSRLFSNNYSMIISNESTNESIIIHNIKELEDFYSKNQLDNNYTCKITRVPIITDNSTDRLKNLAGI